MQSTMPSEPTVVISLADLFRFVRRGLVWALFVGLAAGVLAFVVSTRLEPRYRAEAVVVAAQSRPDTSDLGVTQFTAPLLDVSDYREASLSDTVLRRALNALGETPDPAAVTALRQALQVRTEETRTSGLLYLEVSDAAAGRAAALTNAVTRALTGWDTDRARESLDRTVRSLEGQIAALGVPGVGTGVRVTGTAASVVVVSD